MKKKLILIIACLLCLAGIDESFSQSKFSYLVSAGASNPTAPDNFDTHWKTGFNLGFEVDYAIHKIFALNSSLQFNRFGIDLQSCQQCSVLPHADDPIPPAFSTVDYGDANAMTLMLNIKLLTPDNGQLIIPYAVGGIGLFRQWMEDDLDVFQQLFESRPLENNTSFLLNGGLGLKMPIKDKFSFFVESNFVTAFTDGNNTNYLPFKTGFIIK